MRIISKFKDYYDRYGFEIGQDPDVRYERGKLAAVAGVAVEKWPRSSAFDDADSYRNLDVHVEEPSEFSRRRPSPIAALPLDLLRVKRPEESAKSKREIAARETATHAIEWVVAGRRALPILCYLQASHVLRGGGFNTTPRRVLRREILDVARHSNLIALRTRRRRHEEPSLVDVPSLSEADVADLVRYVGAPVFKIAPSFGGGLKKSAWSDEGRCLVHEVPVLAEHGWPAVATPAQAWQDIYWALTNVLRRDVDKEPPRTVSNDERVIAAGFDLKTSFRR